MAGFPGQLPGCPALPGARPTVLAAGVGSTRVLVCTELTVPAGVSIQEWRNYGSCSHSVSTLGSMPCIPCVRR